MKATAIALLLVAVTACGVAQQQFPQIKHVIFIIQENRTFDNIFAGCPACLPGADIATSGIDSHGRTIPLAAAPLATKYDLGHTHQDWVKQFDGGKMDGADKIGCVGKCPKNPNFTYVQPGDIGPYYQLAGKYTLADHMFTSQRGPSYPAHLYLIGDSESSDHSGLYAAENPTPAKNSELVGGCTSDPKTTVRMLNSSGLENTSMYPCFEKHTLIDLMDRKGMSYKYYAVSGVGQIWEPVSTIRHLCTPDQAGNCTNPLFKRIVVGPGTKPLFDDIANHQLPEVSWVTPSGQASDHPLQNDGSGPSWVASIVNAIGNSPYWANTAIFITWDDWGGFYDHVAPATRSQFEYGFRVPLIVVSPFAKRGYVSHMMFDFGSFQRFIEDWQGLPRLGGVDADAGDLSACFDFTAKQTPFTPIKAKYDAKWFMSLTEKPTDPDDD